VIKPAAVDLPLFAIRIPQMIPAAPQPQIKGDEVKRRADPRNRSDHMEPASLMPKRIGT